MNPTLQQSSQDFIKVMVGSNYSDYNCWQLVKAYYNNVRGIYLPDYPTDNRLSVVEANKIFYSKIDKPVEGDLILFKCFGVPGHIGIYLDEERFLHSTENTGVVVERFTLWKNRVEGFYRVV